MEHEIVERYTSLADQFDARVQAAPEDAWSKPSPCAEWTAKDVVAHVVRGQRNVIGAVTGDDTEYDVEGNPKEAWRASYAAMKAALRQPGALEKMTSSPVGDMPIGELVGRFLSNDVLVHTWDLARSVGGDERLDAAAVAQAHSGLKPLDEMLRQPGIFGPKIPSAADADEQEQFLNFLGRVTRP